MRIGDMKPDWEERWTAKQAEAELSVDGQPGSFVFEGPGWYIEKDDTMLVCPESEVDNPWIQKWPEDTIFRFLVYNGRNPADVFNAIVNAPTRLDSRQ